MLYRFKESIPNLLSLFRLISVLPLTYFSLLNLKTPFLVFYPLAGFSDVIDGYLARKFKTESILGKKLDSLADNLFISFSILWIYLFKIEEFSKVLIPLLLLGLYAILIQAISLLKFKKFETLHLWSLKILMLPSIMLFFYIILIGKIPLLFVYLVVFLGIIGHTEKLLVLLVSKKEPNESISSIFELEDVRQKIFTSAKTKKGRKDDRCGRCT